MLSIFTGLTFSAYAKENEGKCGEEVNSFFDAETETLTISGNGNMYNYTMETSPFYADKEIKHLVVETGVKSVGAFAFCDCTALSDIKLPFGLQSIGNSAFDGCTSLLSAAIPDSVSTLGSGAFINCKKLSSVNVPKGVSVISDWAFSGCKSLRGVVIPDNVKIISQWAFYGCTALRSLSLGRGVNTIEKAAFSYCSALNWINIPAGVNTISDYAFAGTTSLLGFSVNGANASYSSARGVLFNKQKSQLLQYPAGNRSASYTVPASVRKIGTGSFWNCLYLNNVIIHEKVSYIDKNALEGSSAKINAYPFSFAFHFAKVNEIPYSPIKLKTPKIKRIKRGRRRITVKWKTDSTLSGYQLQYSTKKNMKRAKRITVKNASKGKRVIKRLHSTRKYYVRIRAYKTVNGKRLYSKWSKKKRIKVK